MTPGGWGGGTLIFHTYVGSGLFGFKILNFNIFLDFPKNKYFLGTKILWIFFFFFGGGVITKLDYI